MICIGAGNEGDTGRHYAGNLKSDRKSSGQTQTVRATSDPAATSAVSATADRAVSVEFQVGAYESSFSLQIWKVYGDEISIELISHPLRHALSCPRHGASDAWSDRTSPVLWHAIPLQPGAGNLPDLSGHRKPSVRRKRHLDLASHPRPPDLWFL